LAAVYSEYKKLLKQWKDQNYESSYFKEFFIRKKDVFLMPLQKIKIDCFQKTSLSSLNNKRV
jgi:hypothetical protein